MKKKMLCLTGVLMLFSVAVTLQMSATPSDPVGVEALGVIDAATPVNPIFDASTVSFSGCVNQCQIEWFACLSTCGNHVCRVLCENAYTDCLTGCL